MKMPTPEDIAGMWQASGLKEKLIFTFLMIVVFRFGAHVPIFGLDEAVLKSVLGSNQIAGLIDMFAGGAFARVTVFALGIGPYITASIILQLLTVVIPHLESLQKEEGEAGRRKISQYTRIATVVLAVFQSSMLMLYLAKAHAFVPGISVPSVFAGGVVALTAGAVFVMWLSELITEKGIGNGASLLIFIGILSRIPYYIESTGKLVSDFPEKIPMLLILLAIFFATIFLIVIMQEAIRKVVIVNARRQVGNKVYGGVNTHIPFKLNPGGVMPIVFSIAIILFPSTILGMLATSPNITGVLKNVVIFLQNNIFSSASFWYYVVYFLLIVVLTFFYASIMPNMQPREIADNLKKYGSSIPGVKPGKPTADLLDKILGRTTFIGALGLGIIALIPGLGSHLTGITTLQGLGATGLIIMVGVALDFINQIKTHLLARQYEAFLKQ